MKIKIDSVRKSLGIEDMADVELLVDVLYKYQEDHDKAIAEERKHMEEEEAEEQQEGGVSPEPNPASLPDQPRKTVVADATLNGMAEGQASREEEEIDENQLRLDIELLTPALKKFHTIREDRDLDKEKMKMMNAKSKKSKGKDSKSTDKARDASREKKKERMYWASMTKILTD